LGDVDEDAIRKVNLRARRKWCHPALL